MDGILLASGMIDSRIIHSLLLKTTWFLFGWESHEREVPSRFFGGLIHFEKTFP